MATFSISVVSNQLLGHFNPDIQHDIFISCSGEILKKLMSSTERQTIAHGKYEKNSNTALKGLKLWLKFYNIIIAYLETFLTVVCNTLSCKQILFNFIMPSSILWCWNNKFDLLLPFYLIKDWSNLMESISVSGINQNQKNMK